jgi:hypothetical protein
VSTKTGAETEAAAQTSNVESTPTPVRPKLLQLNFDNPADRADPVKRQKVIDAYNTAMAEGIGPLPADAKGMVINVTWGKEYKHGIGLYNFQWRVGRITLEGDSVDLLKPTELAGLIWHEGRHVSQTAQHGPRWTQQDIDRWHQEIYPKQWELMHKNPLFYSKPGGDWYETIKHNCKTACK